MKLRLFAAALVAASLCAHAQDYPNKPIKWIAPLAAGSAVDAAARVVAAKMSENLGQQIVVENLPGAAGLIGAERVAKSPPDGYTFGAFNDSVMTMVPNMHPKMPWDTLKDFDAVSLVGTIEWGLVAGVDKPYRSAADLIAAAKANPGKIDYGSGGNGSPQHVAMELFKSRAGVFITHIPYRGATAAALDAASGQVDIHLSGLPTVAGLVRGGKIKLLGVGSLKRLPQFPDAPTIAESGLPGFEFNSFYAIVAPRGTPKEVIQRLHSEVVKATQAPDVRDKLIAQGFIIRASSPQELDRQTREQLERYAKLFKQAGIKVD